MALLIDKDGTETISGGITEIRAAFVSAGKGRLACIEATMAYEHSDGATPNAQVLTFVGTLDDGTPFDVTSDPLLAGRSPVAEAKRMATKLIEDAS